MSKSENQSSRRQFIKIAAVAPITPIILSGCTPSLTSDSFTPTPTPTPTVQAYTTPDEGATHTATWMAFGATASAWGMQTYNTGTLNIFGEYDISNSIDTARFDLLRPLHDPINFRVSGISG